MPEDVSLDRALGIAEKAQTAAQEAAGACQEMKQSQARQEVDCRERMEGLSGDVHHKVSKLERCLTVNVEVDDGQGGRMHVEKTLAQVMADHLKLQGSSAGKMTKALESNTKFMKLLTGLVGVAALLGTLLQVFLR